MLKALPCAQLGLMPRAIVHLSRLVKEAGAVGVLCLARLHAPGAAGQREGGAVRERGGAVGRWVWCHLPHFHVPSEARMRLAGTRGSGRHLGTLHASSAPSLSAYPPDTPTNSPGAQPQH